MQHPKHQHTNSDNTVYRLQAQFTTAYPSCQIFKSQVNCIASWRQHWCQAANH